VGRRKTPKYEAVTQCFIGVAISCTHTMGYVDYRKKYSHILEGGAQVQSSSYEALLLSISPTKVKAVWHTFSI